MRLEEIQKKTSTIFREYGIKYAAVFGSVARGEDTPESDIDFLVTLGEKPMGMFRYMGFIEKMEEKLKRKVDIVTEASADKFLKPYILSDLKMIYEG